MPATLTHGFGCCPSPRGVADCHGRCPSPRGVADCHARTYAPLVGPLRERLGASSSTALETRCVTRRPAIARRLARHQRDGDRYARHRRSRSCRERSKSRQLLAEVGIAGSETRKLATQSIRRTLEQLCVKTHGSHECRILAAMSPRSQCLPSHSATWSLVRSACIRIDALLGA
jgi:hypothetical protein